MTRIDVLDPKALESIKEGLEDFVGDLLSAELIFCRSDIKISRKNDALHKHQ